MKLTRLCCKCGSTCSPAWCAATDQMRYRCVCGYAWSAAPLDAPRERTNWLKEFERRMGQEAKRFDKEQDKGIQWDTRLRAYSYAPGNYTITCWDCQQHVDGCDKRAFRCKACAEVRLTAYLSTAAP